MTTAEKIITLKPRWDLLFPLAACLLAVFLRYHFLHTYPFPLMIHEQDAVGYMDAARNIMQLHPLDMAGRPPGYPTVISLFALLPVPMEYAARLASIFMDALVTVPLYVLARGHLGRIPSLAVALLWASFGFGLYFSTSPLSQSSYLCFLLGGVVLLREGQNRNDLRLLFCAGNFLALSFLARPEGIVAFGCGMILCLVPLVRKSERTRRRVLAPLLFLLGFLLLALPFFVSFHHQMGYWGITAKTEAALKTQDGTMVLNAQGELSRTAPGKSVWKEYYGSVPVFVSAVAGNIRAYGSVFLRIFPSWMHLLSLAGCLALFTKRGQLKDIPILLILLAVLSPNFVVNVSKTPSYLYAAFPLFLLLLVAGATLPFDLLRWGLQKFSLPCNARYLEHASAVAVLVIVAFVSVQFYRQAAGAYQDEAGEAQKTELIFKQPAELIKANSRNDDVIMTRWGLVGYFADRKVVMLPKGGVEEVINYGRKNGSRFLLIDTESVFSRRQELMELLAPLEGKVVNPAYGLEVLFRKYYPEAGGFVVYRYLPQGAN